MKKEIKIVIVGLVICITIMALIAPKVRYYLLVGDIITIRNNMEKVAHALESFADESYGKYPQLTGEITQETNKPIAAFFSKEKWYEPPVFPFGRDWFKPTKDRTVNVRDRWCKPIRWKRFYRVINFKRLTDTIPRKSNPCRIYIYSDGVRYKIIGVDKEGFLVPEDITKKRGTSNPKIIYSENYLNEE